VGQYYVERHYARGSLRALPPTPLQRLRRSLLHLRPEPVPPLAGAPWVAPHE
jgi:polar amino acid transport system permease protein